MQQRRRTGRRTRTKRGGGDSTALFCPQVTQEQTVGGRKGRRTRPGKGQRSLKAAEEEKNSKQTETDSPPSPHRLHILAHLRHPNNIKLFDLMTVQVAGSDAGVKERGERGKKE